MPDPSFLGDVIMISGVDASYAPTYGNGQINYGNTYYFNYFYTCRGFYCSWIDIFNNDLYNPQLSKIFRKKI